VQTAIATRGKKELFNRDIEIRAGVEEFDYLKMVMGHAVQTRRERDPDFRHLEPFHLI
jgi:hypothetical protein